MQPRHSAVLAPLVFPLVQLTDYFGTGHCCRSLNRLVETCPNVSQALVLVVLPLIDHSVTWGVSGSVAASPVSEGA